jgi:DNA-binding transcriptional LysR family regulator
MPAMSDFTQAYPSIKLDLAVSANPTNLSKRETDIAIRIIKVGETPPPYLVGRKLVTYVEAVYVARKMLNKNVNWLVDNEEERMPHWLCQSDISKIDSYHSVDHLMAKFAAVKAGFGMAILPCCFGDSDGNLVRVPSTKLTQGKEIWLLNHIDMKNVVRVQIFKKFIRAYFETQKDLLEGRLPKA